MPERCEDRISLIVDGQVVSVAAGSSVAAALCAAGIAPRRSRTGQLRGALCGMGVCHECRARVDGIHHQRTCQIPCADGMWIATDA